MSVNKVILVGNVGKDPEVRYLDNGIARATFSLATSENYTNKAGEKVTTTEWHNIVVWRERAKFAETYIKKGMQIFVEGRISSRTYMDKDNIEKRIYEILVENIQLLGRKQDGVQSGQDSSGSPAQTQSKPDNAVNDDDVSLNGKTDDLPF